jgi:hypothetical protein
VIACAAVLRIATISMRRRPLCWAICWLMRACSSAAEGSSSILARIDRIE